MGGMKAARFYLEHIYLDEGDVNEYRWLARSRHPVALLSEATGDSIQSSVRYREVIGPLGLMYEARSVSTMGGDLWGAMDLAREHGRPDFSAREVTLLRRIAPHLGAGLKAAVLRSQASAEANSDRALGVLMLDSRGRVLHHTTGAERLLADLGSLGPGWQEGDGLPAAVWAVIGALRRALKAETERDRESVPRVCVRARSGRWLTLQASLSESHLGSQGEIVLIIEPAGPKEMAWLNTAAYGLSPREREIVDLIVRGLPSKQIAASLYVTEDTVQKHLSKIFEKVGVRSRLALVKRLYLNTIFP
jgi:DNA-binding CsgD family transcriptional regulator